MLYESQNFRVEADDSVLTLWLDFRGRRGHTFTLPILHELNLLLDRLAGLPAPDAMIVRSTRPGIFLEEFDSAELARFDSPLEFAALARRGQEAARKIAGLPFPTVSLVEGRCAGAGLELALACDRRWLVSGPHARFEFMEADRGLIPCWGGTVRLARLVGPSRAMRLMAGGIVGPVAARRVGLADELISTPELQARLITLVDRLREAGGKPRRPIRQILRQIVGRLVPVASLGSPTVGADSGEVRPEAEVRRVIATGRGCDGEGLAAERAAFTRLATSPAARQRLELHRRAGGTVRVLPEPVNPVLPAPRRIAIVGGGDLGSRLACRFARLGHEVVVHVENPAAAERAAGRVAGQFAEAAERGLFDEAEGRRLTQATRITSTWVGVENADFAVEAAAEDPGVKRNVFQELERRVRPRVPLATASTTIPVDLIQAETSRPGRIIGLHLPNPDDSRPVAEIVASGQTESGTIAALALWARAWGFLPVRVADRPGRLVEHVRLTYLSEGVSLVAEGLPIARVDAGCRDFGMALGPLEWCDRIGLDRLAELVAQLQLARGDRFARNLLFQRLLPFGTLGRDVGEGFYRYGFIRRPSHLARMILWQDLDEDARAPYVFDPREAIREGIDRLVLRTVNEAAAGLADEPDSDPATVDVALAFGMGWAPSRGGPLRYADALGIPTIVERLASYAERFGPRYDPCDELVRRAEAGETFYDGPTEIGSPAPAWRLAG